MSALGKKLIKAARTAIAAEARRQSLAVASSPHAQDDQALIGCDRRRAAWEAGANGEWSGGSVGRAG
jgi:hypothetical protein